MNIDNLLLNVSSNVIETVFISRTVLETLKRYDEDLLIPSKIRGLVSIQIPHAEMLRNKLMRNALIQSIQDDKDINQLASIFGMKPNNNNRLNLLKINISANSEKEKKLFEFFEVNHITIDNSKDIPDKKIIRPQRSLFNHQREAVDKIQNYLNGDIRAALLHMPTGSGKTRTTMRVISNIFMNSKPTIVIWIALTTELCEQAVEEFQNTWEVIGDRDVKIFRFFGNHTPNILEIIDKNDEGFIVAGMSKLDKVQDDQFLTRLADHVNLVVMDEAHHAIAPTYKRTITILAKKHKETKLLGLSATPGRTLETMSEKNIQLADFFGINKVTLKIQGQNPIRFLIDNEYIAEPDIKIIKHTDKLTDKERSQISREFDIPKKILETLGSDVIRNIKIISSVEELINNNQKRIIIFAPSIQSSRDISMILSARGHTAYYVDSKLSSHLRDQIISKYKEKSNDVIILCNVNLLTAGFDAPQTSGVVIARPTKSLVMYSQMIGRAIRGKKVNGNKKCFIRVITDKSIMEFKNIVTAFEHWEKEWE